MRVYNQFKIKYEAPDIIYADNKKIIVAKDYIFEIFDYQGNKIGDFGYPEYYSHSSSVYDIKNNLIYSFAYATQVTIYSTFSFSSKGFQLKYLERFNPVLGIIDVSKLQVINYRVYDYPGYLGSMGGCISYLDNALYCSSEQKNATYFCKLPLDTILDNSTWTMINLDFLTPEYSFCLDVTYFKGYVYTLWLYYDTEAEVYRYYLIRFKPDLSEYEIIDEYAIPSADTKILVWQGLDSDYKMIAYVEYVSKYDYETVYRINWSYDGNTWDWIDIKYDYETAIWYIKILGKYIYVFAIITYPDGMPIICNIKVIDTSTKQIVDEYNLWQYGDYNNVKYSLYCKLKYWVNQLYTLGIYERVETPKRTDYFIQIYKPMKMIKMNLKYVHKLVLVTKKPYIELTITDEEGYPVANKKIEVYKVEGINTKNSPTGTYLTSLITDEKGKAYLDLTPYIGKKLVLGFRYEGEL